MCAKENIELLKNSLLYQMSLGSKELYHSNVWAWLLQQDCEYLKVFFDGIDLDDYDEIKDDAICRELAHRDITIYLHKKGCPEKQGKCYLVIENKIKSLPTKEQLEAYTKDLEDNELIAATYTGIRSILEPQERKIAKQSGKIIEWGFRSYKDIADKIAGITYYSGSEVIIKHQSQILEYCNNIRILNDLLEQSLLAQKETLCFDAPFDLSNQCIRLDDVFKKLKGADFLSYVRGTERLNELQTLRPKGYRFETWQSYNNKQATLDIRFCNWNKEGPYFEMGIQIQGTQYRRMALVDKKTASKLNPDGPAKNTAEAIFRYLADEKWFDADFDAKSERRTIWGKTTQMKAKFDKYGEEFVYQYCNVSQENGNASYDALFENIKEDLQKAKAILEKLNGK